ncbi:hypothetical protein [Mycoplasmoides fastidiosum]|nr:hypothetical protein [Mycoplasmoides fastidiosum]UUD37895.1 hypothetical protein NPA10_00660 [Mycoplasmoides fastidiosum]
MILSACAENPMLSHSQTEKQTQNPQNQLNPEEFSKSSEKPRQEKSFNSANQNNSSNDKSNKNQLSSKPKTNNLTDVKDNIKNKDLLKEETSFPEQNSESIDSKIIGHKSDNFSKKSQPNSVKKKNNLNIHPTSLQKERAKILLNRAEIKNYFSKQISESSQNFLRDLGFISQATLFDQSDLLEKLKQLFHSAKNDKNLIPNPSEISPEINLMKDLLKLIQDDQNHILSTEQKNVINKILKEISIQSESLFNNLLSIFAKQNNESFVELQTTLETQITNFVSPLDEVTKVNLNTFLSTVNQYFSYINEITNYLTNLKDIVFKFNKQTEELEQFISTNHNISKENDSKQQFYNKLTTFKNSLKINILKYPIDSFSNQFFNNDFLNKNRGFKIFNFNLQLYKIDAFIKDRIKIINKLSENIKILIYNRNLLNFNDSALNLFAANLDNTIYEDAKKIKSYWESSQNKIKHFLETENNISQLEAILKIISNYKTDPLNSLLKTDQEIKNWNDLVIQFNEIWRQTKTVLWNHDEKGQVYFPIIKQYQEINQQINITNNYQQILEIFGTSEELFFTISQILEIFSETSSSYGASSLMDIINTICSTNDITLSQKNKTDGISFIEFKTELNKLQKISNDTLNQMPNFLIELLKINESNVSTVLNKNLALIFNNGMIISS